MKFGPMKTARRLLIALSIAVTGPAFAGSIDLPLQVGGAFSVRVTSLKEARFAATVRQQHDFSCGSAAVSTLLRHHYGRAVSEAQVFDAMFRDGDAAKIEREGFSLLDMKRYLAAQGLEADGFEAPLADLADARVPAIVLVHERGYNHFVVVKGLRDGRVLIGDPAAGTRAIGLPAFDAMRVNGILFVVANHPDEARFNLAADWQAVPRAPLGGRDGIDRSAISALPKLGAGDF